MSEHIPDVLTTLVTSYLTLEDLVEIVVTNLPELPSTKPWKRLLKQRYSEVYAVFKSGQFLNGLTHDQITIMIIAGLYESEPPLSLYKLIDDDFNLKLYLELTYAKYCTDPQVMYDTIKHRGKPFPTQSMLYLFGLKARLDAGHLVRLITQTTDSRIVNRLIRRGIRWYGRDFLKTRIRVFRLSIPIYTYLLVRFPALALKYIGQTEVFWSSFDIFLSDGFGAVEPYPDFDYATLFQAYHERLGLLPFGWLRGLPSELEQLLEPYREQHPTHTPIRRHRQEKI